MKKTIKINGEEYTLGGKIRAMLMWEYIANKAFALEMTTDILLYYFCLLVAGGYPGTWEAFLDALDADPTLMARMSESVKDDNVAALLDNEEPESGKKKVE